MRAISLLLLTGVAFAEPAVPEAKPKPTSSPIPIEKLNGELPHWMKFSFDERLRLEGFSGNGFKPDSSDTYLLQRLRVNIDVLPASWMKFRFQMQDARVFWKSLRPYAP